MTGFFDHQNLWKETINVLHFLHADINHGMMVYKTTTNVWIWPDVPSHVYTCLDLLGLNLVGLELEYSHIKK